MYFIVKSACLPVVDSRETEVLLLKSRISLTPKSKNQTPHLNSKPYALNPKSDTLNPRDVAAPVCRLNLFKGRPLKQLSFL